MDVGGYRQRLIEPETKLSSHIRRDVTSGRDQLIDTAADAGDASVANESESEDFTEAEFDATMLQLVQAALRQSRTAPMKNASSTEDRSIRNASTPCRGRHIAHGTRSCLKRRLDRS